MSEQINTIENIVDESGVSDNVKQKKPTLSAKHTKLLHFGFWVSSIIGSEEIKFQLHNLLCLFGTVEEQIELFELFLSEEKEVAKMVRKCIAEHNKPPKPVKEKEPKAPRKGKGVVHQDTLISQLIQDANAEIGENIEQSNESSNKEDSVKIAKEAEKLAKEEAKKLAKEAKEAEKLAKEEANKLAKETKEAEKSAAKLAKEKAPKKSKIVKHDKVVPEETEKVAHEEAEKLVPEQELEAEIIEEPTIVPAQEVKTKPAKKPKQTKPKEPKEPKTKKSKKEQAQNVAPENEEEETEINTVICMIGEKQYIMDPQTNIVYELNPPHDVVGVYNHETCVIDNA